MISFCRFPKNLRSSLLVGNMIGMHFVKLHYRSICFSYKINLNYIIGEREKIKRERHFLQACTAVVILTEDNGENFPTCLCGQRGPALNLGYEWVPVPEATPHAEWGILPPCAGTSEKCGRSRSGVRCPAWAEKTTPGRSVESPPTQQPRYISLTGPPIVLENIKV